MTTLRVLLTDAPDAARADAWALFDDRGHVVQEGRGPSAEWPRADRTEAVLAAERCRLVELVLPPLGRDKLSGAVAYAMEDRLAATADPPRMAYGAQRTDGRV